MLASNLQNRHETSFVRRTDGDLLLQHETTENRTHWYLNDGLGSVSGLIRDGGHMADTASYTDYGFPTLGGGYSSRFAFTGEQWDATFGLSHYYARSYDPVAGSWLQPDPVKGELTQPASQHRYSYVASNPATYLDAYGYARVRTLQLSALLRDVAFNGGQFGGAWLDSLFALLRSSGSWASSGSQARIDYARVLSDALAPYLDFVSGFERSIVQGVSAYFGASGGFVAAYARYRAGAAATLRPLLSARTLHTISRGAWFLSVGLGVIQAGSAANDAYHSSTATSTAGRIGDAAFAGLDSGARSVSQIGGAYLLGSVGAAICAPLGVTGIGLVAVAGCYGLGAAGGGWLGGWGYDTVKSVGSWAKREIF